LGVDFAMSTTGKRSYRPKIHFSPPKMWMNDPNGLVFADGVFHLFYQHNPYDTVWGPMHWGHAISSDLIRWEHLPIALFPDNNGTVFSGSAVIDKDNTSGLGDGSSQTMILVFTQDHYSGQNQGIAYSNDYINFQMYKGNPVIPNPGCKNFRDPKVIYLDEQESWVMVLAAGKKVNFYKSEDLINWLLFSTFILDEDPDNIVWECVDLIKIDDKWVLLGSTKTSGNLITYTTRYIIGNFDGEKFEAVQAPRLFDYGFDNYASVSYNNISENIFVGWFSNWIYATRLPTGEYCGTLTLPRCPIILETPYGEILSFKLHQNVLKLFNSFIQVQSHYKLESEVFMLDIKGLGAFCITVGNSQEYFCIKSDGSSITVDRRNAGENFFSDRFASEAFSVAKIKRFFSGECNIIAVFDVSHLEVFADNGTLPVSMLCFPRNPYEYIEFSGEVTVSISEFT
jgi:fructan beta-fructosidase